MVAVIGLGTAALVAWLAWRGSFGQAVGPESASPTAAVGGSTATRANVGGASAVEGVDSTAPAVRTATEPSSDPTEPSRYEGVGRIQVFATARGNLGFPAAWTLELEPSKVLIGGEHAVARRIELTHGEREVLVEDVALGGYTLRAFAPGLDSEPQTAWLAKPDSTFLVVPIEMYEAGYLTGRVVDESGDPLEGLRVVVAPAAPTQSRTRREAVTDASGNYLFELLADGEYVIAAGDERSPLGPTRELSFLAPSLHMPDLVVPELGAVEVRVVDRIGKPVPGARVTAYGTRGAPPPVESDENGRARIPHLVPGPVSLVAEHAELGEGRARGEVALPESAEIELMLRR